MGRDPIVSVMDLSYIRVQEEPQVTLDRLHRPMSLAVHT